VSNKGFLIILPGKAEGTAGRYLFWEGWVHIAADLLRGTKLALIEPVSQEVVREIPWPFDVFIGVGGVEELR